MEKQNRKEGKLSKLPVCAADFIKHVIKKMRYRKKVRRDVQAELAAHFEDELKGIKTEAEKEQKARQIVGKFGDARLLAVLLRRAKKRCRPLWKTAVARTFQTAGIIILCFIVYVVWFFTGKPVITTDYVAELNRIVKPSSDGTLNAAPFYQKAVPVFKKLPKDISKLLPKNPHEITSEQKKLIEKWIDDNEKTLELVIAGSQKPYYWQTYEGEEMLSVFVPHLSGYRNIARSLGWRAQLRAEQGRYEDAFDDIKSCYRFGRHIKGDGLLIEQLVGIVIEAISVQTIRDILSQHKIDSATLTNLQDDFEQMLLREDFTASLIAEKISTYDVIQRTFTDGLGNGHIIPARFEKLLADVQVISAGPARGGSVSADEYQHPGFLAGLMLLIRLSADSVCSFAKNNGYILFMHPDKQKTLRAAQQVYDYWETLKVKTPAQIRAEGINPEKEAMEIIKGNLLLEKLVPVLDRITEIVHRHKVNVEATPAIMAILRYYQETGDYPQDLDDLIKAGFLKACPIDPFSDKPLIYRKVGNNFILYGVGPNFIDDGGQVAVIDDQPRQWGTREAGDWVFWPVSQSQSNQ